VNAHTCIPEERAVLISGHRTRSVFDPYDITDERDLQAYGEQLVRYLKSKTKMAEELDKLAAEKLDELCTAASERLRVSNNLSSNWGATW
jgi:hypothetical protein